MPNIEHWSFVKRLLDGSWEYEGHGLLDTHHLRWFTPRNTRELLEQAGLVPLDITPRVFDQAAQSDFAARLAPGLEAGSCRRPGLPARAELGRVWPSL